MLSLNDIGYLVLGTEAEFKHSDCETDFPLLAQSRFIFSPKMVRVKFIHMLHAFVGHSVPITHSKIVM